MRPLLVNPQALWPGQSQWPLAQASRFPLLRPPSGGNNSGIKLTRKDVQKLKKPRLYNIGLCEHPARNRVGIHSPKISLNFPSKYTDYDS